MSDEPPAGESAPRLESTPLQRRALAIVRVVQAGSLRVEAAIPERSRRIDAVLDVDLAHPAWGPIRADLEGRTVALEHFGAPPAAAALGSIFLKLAALLDRWLADPRPASAPRPARAPLALVLSVGQPTAALELLRLRARPLRGCYEAALGPAELLLVDVRALPPGPGTALLRLFDHRPAVVGENLRRLFDDPEIDSSTKLALGEAIMAEPAIWDPVEQRLTAQEILARGRAEGRVAGQRELLRTILAGREGALSARVDTALSACADPVRLQVVGQLLARPLDGPALEAAVLATLRGDAPR